MANCIWITWEDHRRSRVLSKEFGCEYIPLTKSSSRALRYPILSARTLALLIKKRPATVFCQNPSVVLCFLCCVLKYVFRYSLIVDRHSNFKFETRNDRGLKWRGFHYLSDFTIRHADYNIVTNSFLVDFCEQLGGVAGILQDKIPDLKYDQKNVNFPEFFDADTRYHVVCVTMFDDDEPINEMLEAAKSLDRSVSVYFTGNFSKMFTDFDREKLGNTGVYLVGFVDEEEYISAMAYADLIVVLTKKEYILNCGSYEAIALGKPMVLSKTETIKEYFGDIPVYADPDSASSICNAIVYGITHRHELIRNVEEQKPVLKRLWDERFWEINKDLAQCKRRQA